MHLQQTKAYSSIPLSPSPSLSNPDMILPYDEDYDSPPSPPRGIQQQLTPPGEDWNDAQEAEMHFSFGPPQTHLGQLVPTTPIIYGNGTMLSDIGEVTETESTIGKNQLSGPVERRLLKQQRASGNNTPLGSSPTIGNTAVAKPARKAPQNRRVSMESNSTATSDGQPVEMFQDVVHDVSVDDSVFQGDDEESVADSCSEEVFASEAERWPVKDRDLGNEEDRYSSAALSRRAEQILLNAKKRLNVGFPISILYMC